MRTSRSPVFALTVMATVIAAAGVVWSSATAEVSIEFDGSYVVRSIATTDATTWDEAKFKHTFTNTGSTEETYRMIISAEYTDAGVYDHGWTMCSIACVGPGTEIEVTLAPAASDTVTLKVFAVNDRGSSTATLSFEEISSGATHEFTYGVVHEGCEVVVIDDTPADDYRDALSSALTVTGRPFGIFDGSIVNIGDSSVDLAAADLVVYTSGTDAAGVLTGSDLAALESFLDGGGTVLMSGDDLFDDIGGSAFATERLGVATVGGTSSTSATGVAGDPVGDGLAFDLTAGAAAPSTPNVLGGSTVFARYADGSAAGIRNNPSGGFNAYSLGFGVESIAASELAALIDAIVNAGSTVPIEEVRWSEVKRRF